MNMKEQLRAVAKEYARQFGKIIGIAPDYWVGGDISLGVCVYSDYFFDLDDIQVVVDNLNKWVKKYGTIEKVGEEVIEWQDWLLGNNYRLGLYAWLVGRRPTSNSVELNKIYRQIEVLNEIVELYPSHTVGNVIMQLEARVKELSKTKEPKDQ
jgi:hypothetical protein